jgi:hypothetical protein
VVVPHKGELIVGVEVTPPETVCEIEYEEGHFAVAVVFIAIAFTTSHAAKFKEFMVQLPPAIVVVEPI